MTITENIRKELQTLVDSKYQEFHSALVPGTENILGVRIPQLRVMAKEIAKRDDWRIFIEATDTKFYEEAMLQGMVIGRSKTALDEQMKYVKRFVPRIDNWAVWRAEECRKKRKRNSMAIYTALFKIHPRIRVTFRNCNASPLYR